MQTPTDSQKTLLSEINTQAKNLVWYSPSQIEIGQHLSDDGSKGDRPWPVAEKTGEFLYKFVIENNIKTVIELGTGIGYSTIWMGFALKQLQGKIFTIERKKVKSDIAKENFKKADIESVVKLYDEEIETAIPKIISEVKSFDLLFFDANRSKFEMYLEMLLPVIGSNTFLIIDNAIDMGERLKHFKKVLENSGWKIETIEIGDGLLICTK